MFFGIAVGFAGLFFLGGREIVVVGSDSLCVELGHSFSIFGLGVVEGISGFFSFFVFWFVVAGLAIPARSRHFEAGAWWWFSVWEFVLNFLCGNLPCQFG